MTFVNDTRYADSGLIGRISEFLRARREARKVRSEQDRVYNQTLRELKSLSERDLTDIGIARSQIEEIASEAAYGK